MKALGVLLGLITATLLPGEATSNLASNVTIRAYNATGKMDITRDPFILGTRVNLTCDVAGISNSSEVLSYKWFHNCTNSMCELGDADPYYRVVNDTLLVNVTSRDQGGKYYCEVHYLQETVVRDTPFIHVAGGTRTPTTSTPEVSDESSPLTPVVSREISASTPVVSEESSPLTPVVSREISASTPVVSEESSPLTPVVSREISASTPVVGEESSPLTPVVSREIPASTPVVSEKSSPLTPVVSTGISASTPVVSEESSPLTPAVSREISASIPAVDKTQTTSTQIVNIFPTIISITTTARSTSNFSPKSSGPQTFSRNPFNTQPDGTFTGVGVGVGMFLLLVFLTSVVVLILVVVAAVRRKGANKQKRGIPLRDNLWYDNSVVVTQEMEMKKEGVPADDGDGYQDVDYDKSEDNPVEDGINQVDDRKDHIKNTKTPAPEKFSTPASATNGPAIYAVVDKSKKKESKTMVEKMSSFDTNNDQYAMPMKKGCTMTEAGEGVGAISEEEQYDETVVYKPKEDSKIWQPNERDIN